jgi:mannose-6-phosphate isomerase-like protein (cupin superfamily)
MKQVSEFIESGVLELYIMGIASTEEIQEVELMAAAFPEIREELALIGRTIEAFALSEAVKPKAAVKPLLLATIEYMERLKNGELFAVAPELTATSKAEDFAFWLSQPQFIEQPDYKGMHVKIISASPQTTTAVVCIKEMTELEIHHQEFERFLILEGTCDFTVGDEVHKLEAGDFIAIPLHVAHIARVTSNIPCKAIVQRIAA